MSVMLKVIVECGLIEIDKIQLICFISIIIIRILEKVYNLINIVRI